MNKKSNYRDVLYLAVGEVAAAAAVVAAVEKGYCEKDTNVTVKLRGGDLTVNYHSDDTVELMGNVKTVYEGTFEI